MPKILAFCRVSTKTQNLTNQENLILKYCNDNKLFVDEWVRLEVSTRKKELSEKLEYIFDRLEKNDILIVSEISRLGRSTGSMISFIESIIEKGVRLIAIKQNIDISKETSNMTSKLMISMFSILGEIERELISERTIMALERVKAEGRTLGRPKGSTGKSKLDGKEKEIQHLLEHKISLRGIARILGCSDVNLKHFIKSRGLYSAHKTE